MLSFCPSPNFRTMFQVNGLELECQHTIKSHGGQLARNHKHDWLILLLLVVIEIILNVINPFYRFVGEDMMTDLKYPMKDNTVPVWAVPFYAVLLPIAIFLLYYLRRRDVYDLHHSILGLLFAVLITGVLTDAIKDAVGRPRPDFFWRCFPDGRDEYDQWGNVVCHGKASDIKEGHKSFPSGHTSYGLMQIYHFTWGQQVRQQKRESTPDNNASARQHVKWSKADEFVGCIIQVKCRVSGTAS
ncbi:UNVERIFIED_CONTAM: Lipid phosphate phosphatase 1 [Sesamum radiatum]|uniref:Lipid phosphate phosphatase 1 n=1 Tax=Sesamum radiatum TaxID=300843 RepID=A0AAW2VP16_SESRA